MSSLIYVEKLETFLASTGKDYKIASGGGRMYVTMDRYEADWQIVKRGWDAMVLGEISESNAWTGKFHLTKEAIEAARIQFPKKTDQDYPPWVITDLEMKSPIGLISDGDTVINFNFRGDRAIEISRAFEDGPDFDQKYFARRKIPKVDYYGLLIYDNDKAIPRRALCPNPDIQNVLTSYLCAAGVTQYAVSETHKFGHVTYFWNGNRSGYFDPAKELYEEVRFNFQAVKGLGEV
jgi:2,3-bisphosphoglycerate-independent phosphoglycerate mutase